MRLIDADNLIKEMYEDQEGGAYYAGDEDKTLTSQDMIVNAWQPLPERYYGETEITCNDAICPYNKGGGMCAAIDGCVKR